MNIVTAAGREGAQRTGTLLRGNLPIQDAPLCRRARPSRNGWVVAQPWFPHCNPFYLTARLSNPSLRPAAACSSTTVSRTPMPKARATTRLKQSLSRWNLQSSPPHPRLVGRLPSRRRPVQPSHQPRQRPGSIRSRMRAEKSLVRPCWPADLRQRSQTSLARSARPVERLMPGTRTPS